MSAELDRLREERRAWERLCDSAIDVLRLYAAVYPRDESLSHVIRVYENAKRKAKGGPS